MDAWESSVAEHKNNKPAKKETPPKKKQQLRSTMNLEADQIQKKEPPIKLREESTLNPSTQQLPTQLECSPHLSRTSTLRNLFQSAAAGRVSDNGASVLTLHQIEVLSELAGDKWLPEIAQIRALERFGASRTVSEDLFVKGTITG